MEKTNFSLLLFLFSLTSLCKSQSDDYNYDNYNYDQYNYDQNNYDEYDYNEKYDYYGHQNLLAPAPLPIQPPPQPVFAGRFLVATGRPPMGDRIISAKLKELSRDWANSSAGEKVEILDLSDPTKKCALLNDIYPARYSGAGGLLKGNPVICGGIEKPSGIGFHDCIVFGQNGKNRKLLMKQNRRGLAAVSINSSLLWLLGSDTITDAQFSTEFISLNEGQSVLGPRMPVKIDGSCVVKYDDTTIYILGGYNGGPVAKNDVWIVNISEEITFKSFSRGPSMLHSRFHHSCSTIMIGNKKLIIAVGGNNKPSGTSMEILDPSVNQWEEGPNLPYQVRLSQMVTSPDGNGIILIGGQHDYHTTAKILELRRDTNGWASSWTTMKQKLKYARNQHVAIPIPNEFTMCA